MFQKGQSDDGRTIDHEPVENQRTSGQDLRQIVDGTTPSRIFNSFLKKLGGQWDSYYWAHWVISLEKSVLSLTHRMR